MPVIEVSDAVYRKFKAFMKVVDAVMGEEVGDETIYADFVLSMGIDKLLQDPLPDDPILRSTMVSMFKKNPEFVAEFIAETLKEGQMGIEKQIEMWKRYIS
ncbi:MAG: hypothetical protein KIH10_12725 [Candidatus Freyarchaeota archaeon]|nr:hypothetical protein [Candidatus Jordarchaeia archaeon]